MTDHPLSPGLTAQVACLLEATARKPGNVHRFVDFADTTYLDFALSAGAIIGPLDLAAAQPLGSTIFRAVEATRRVVGSNTNLGMILLLAPLAAVPIGSDLRSGVATVLGATTEADAVAVYRAIRLANPGGLGRSAEGQDLADEPSVNLLEAMRLAADRDLVARQYASGFADVFDHLVPSLTRHLDHPRTLETAIILAYLEALARRPDTLIARKLGLKIAIEASSRATAILQSGWPDEAGTASKFDQFDAWLRADGHARNPGATADLVAAGLFVALRTGTIPWPSPTAWSTAPLGPPRS